MDPPLSTSKPLELNSNEPTHLYLYQITLTHIFTPNNTNYINLLIKSIHNLFLPVYRHSHLEKLPVLGLGIR